MVNVNINFGIGPGSHEENDTKILSIKDSRYYYAIEDEKLMEKYQPFTKGEIKIKPFKISNDLAPS